MNNHVSNTLHHFTFDGKPETTEALKVLFVTQCIHLDEYALHKCLSISALYGCNYQSNSSNFLQCIFLFLFHLRCFFLSITTDIINWCLCNVIFVRCFANQIINNCVVLCVCLMFTVCITYLMDLI